MRHALALAQRGWGRAQPNPLVGAVVVRDGRIVGEGWHAEFGGPHAEVDALRSAGDLTPGSTLYVTLEPCAHHGQTPPCTDAIIDAGITHVVFAASDANPLAQGGAEVLARAGVRVTAGVEREAARRQNSPFFHAHEHDTPWFTLKLATSIDGRIAAAAGSRTHITGKAAAAETHRLRAGHDAVLIGIGTALADDPMLTVREVPARRQPTRVVLDSGARIPLDSRLVRSVDAAPVLVVCGPSAPDARVAALTSAGVVVRRVRSSSSGIDPIELASVLHAEGLRSVFVEGGSRVAGSLLEAGLIHRLHLFVAPTWIGNRGVLAFHLEAPVHGAWSHTAADRFGDDIMLTLECTGSD